MDSARIAYSQRPDATPEAEAGALANVYKFVLDSHARKEATRPGSPDDATKGSKCDRARTIIQESK
jgi:hypothetical protein